MKYNSNINVDHNMSAQHINYVVQLYNFAEKEITGGVYSGEQKAICICNYSRI
ncbi:MAG: hypothetical protein ABF289_15260 [Clostridiales bacterium]